MFVLNHTIYGKALIQENRLNKGGRLNTLYTTMLIWYLNFPCRAMI